MSFLAELVPAWREVRAPLAAGYIYLFTGWLAFGQHVPAANDLEPGSVGALANRAFDAMGPAGELVVVTFVAYLLGSFIDDLGSVFLERIGVLTKFNPSYGRPRDDFEADQLAGRIQLLTEAKVRAEVALASTSLVVVLTMRQSVYWILLVLVPVVLVAQALLVINRVRANWPVIGRQ